MKIPLLAWLLWLVLAATDAPAPEGASAPSAPASRGALMFADAFSAGPGASWSFDRDSVWVLKDGHLRAELPPGKQLRSFAYFGSEKWKDYAVDLDVCGVRGVDKGIAVRVEGERGVGIDLRAARYNDVLMYRGYEHWARAPVPNQNGTWYHVRVVIKRNRYRVFVNGDSAIDFTDETSSRSRGKLALAAYTGGVGECVVMFDNVEVREVK